MSAPVTLDTYLRAAARRFQKSDTPLLDARVLAQRALGLDAAGIILRGDSPLDDGEAAAFDTLVARRAGGEPVAHIVGEKEFFGLSFETAPGVLVPRPDSETVVEAVLARRPATAPLRVLDLGTGTGCLLLSILAAMPNANGFGLDINPDAAALASRNAARLGLADRATFAVGDWLASLGARFDLIVSNPPYIADEDYAHRPDDIRLFEDRRALSGGADGLDAYRRILAAAPGALADGGLMVFEIGADQAQSAALLAEKALSASHIEIIADLAGRPRVLVADLIGEKSV